MQDNKMPKAQVRNLTKKFGDLLVLNDISFDVRSGEFLCIVGPTGCGKTTFLNSLTKLYQPTAGEILLDGEPVDLKKHNIAYIFQEYSTMPWLTVEENVGFGLDIKGVEKEKAKALVNEYLDIVGLTKYRKYYPDQLSASMLQRVVIARALAVSPELIIADESTSMLDVSAQAQVIQIYKRLIKEQNVSFIFISHNLPLVKAFCSKVYGLQNGMLSLMKGT